MSDQIKADEARARYEARQRDPNDMDYIPRMKPVDMVIVMRYVNQNAYDLHNYGIGQGSIYKYHGDEATLTITVKQSEQVPEGDDDFYSAAELLEDFQENYGSAMGLDDFSPEYDGLAEFSVHYVWEPIPED